MHGEQKDAPSCHRIGAQPHKAGSMAISKRSEMTSRLYQPFSADLLLGN